MLIVHCKWNLMLETPLCFLKMKIYAWKSINIENYIRSNLRQFVMGKCMYYTTYKNYVYAYNHNTQFDNVTNFIKFWPIKDIHFPARRVIPMNSYEYQSITWCRQLILDYWLKVNTFMIVKVSRRKRIYLFSKS